MSLVRVGHMFAFEHMSQVSAARAANDLDALHAVRHVGVRLDGALVALVKRRPAAARVELGGRAALCCCCCVWNRSVANFERRPSRVRALHVRSPTTPVERRLAHFASKVALFRVIFVVLAGARALGALVPDHIFLFGRQLDRSPIGSHASAAACKRKGRQKCGTKIGGVMVGRCSANQRESKNHFSPALSLTLTANVTREMIVFLFCKN